MLHSKIVNGEKENLGNMRQIWDDISEMRFSSDPNILNQKMNKERLCIIDARAVVVVMQLLRQDSSCGQSSCCCYPVVKVGQQLQLKQLLMLCSCLGRVVVVVRAVVVVIGYVVVKVGQQSSCDWSSQFYSGSCCGWCSRCLWLGAQWQQGQRLWQS